MDRTVPIRAALALAVLALLIATRPADATSRHHRSRAVCAPVYIEGAGTVQICAPARAR